MRYAYAPFLPTAHAQLSYRLRPAGRTALRRVVLRMQRIQAMLSSTTYYVESTVISASTFCIVLISALTYPHTAGKLRVCHMY